jgi:probable phosphoglycerate mutase
MKVLLIRHADPDYRRDTITETGHRQARRLAEELDRYDVGEILSSSYGRAIDTAAYSAKLLGLEMSAHDWLREVNGNYNPGCPGTLAYHGADLFADGRPVSIENWAERVPYGAHTREHSRALLESFRTFMQSHGYRQEGLRYRATERAERKTVAVFCHAGAILTLLAELLHIPIPVVYAQFTIDPASVTVLRLEEKDGYGVFRLEGLNDTSCLGSFKTTAQQRTWAEA